MGDNVFYTIGVALSVSVGGFLAGFGLVATVSGFSANDPSAGALLPGSLLAAAIAMLLAGPISDRLGRRKLLLASSILIFVAAGISTIASNFAMLAIARVISGLGAGSALLVSGMYLAEISPAGLRGRRVMLVFLLFAVGLLAALAAKHWLFGIEAALALAWLGLLILVPESPRWLAMQGLKQEALSVLRKTTSLAQADVDLQAIQASIHDEITSQGVRWTDLFRASMRGALMIGLVLAVLQPFAGVTTVMPQVAPFQAALVLAVFTGITLFTIDYLGRRLLMMAGLGLMSACLFLLVFGHSGDAVNPALVNGASLGYVAGFSLSLGPVMWVLFSELYPNRLRGMAMAFVGCLNLLVGLGVLLVSPSIMAMLGASLSFLVHAVVCLLVLALVVKYLPETRGRSLEELEWELVGR